MATYLVTLAIGEFDVRDVRSGRHPVLGRPRPRPVTLDLDPETEGPSAGEVAEGSLARQPEIIDFLAGVFGPYPFASSGGIVDDSEELRFALETQTRPDLRRGVLLRPDQRRPGRRARAGPPVDRRPAPPRRVAAHLAERGVRHVRRVAVVGAEGLATAQEIFDDVAANAPPEFWETTIGDPGPTWARSSTSPSTTAAR